MNVIKLAQEAGMRWEGGFTRVIECVTEAELTRFAALVRAAALDEAIKIIEEYRIPVGDSAAGEIEKANAFARAVIARYAPQQTADDEVVFIDGVGAGRSSIKSCRDGVQWIKVGDRVYWPLSDSDAKRLQSACCGNGSFDGPTTPAGDGAQKGVVAWARPVYARPVHAPEPAEEWGELVDVEFHNRPEKPEGEGWRPLVVADTGRQSMHSHDCWSWGHGHYECAAGKVERLQVEVEKLRADLVESDEIREKLGRLLTHTAAALKGEPPEGVWHSWHDLPEKATQLVAALRKLEERVQRDEALLRQALEALERAHRTAMEQTLKARIPECAEFAGIAQDLDFVVAALRERLGEKEQR